jgi:hypothetical protein
MNCMDNPGFSTVQEITLELLALNYIFIDFLFD